VTSHWHLLYKEGVRVLWPVHIRQNSTGKSAIHEAQEERPGERPVTGACSPPAAARKECHPIGGAFWAHLMSAWEGLLHRRVLRRLLLSERPAPSGQIFQLLLAGVAVFTDYEVLSGMAAKHPLMGWGLMCSHGTKQLISFSVTNCKWRHPDMQRKARESGCREQ
jgi:hypothetical protein